MPNTTPKTDPVVALEDIVKAAQGARSDITWPAVSLALAGMIFDSVLGQYLAEQGARHPDVDLWNGSGFADFRNLVLREIVPKIVHSASAALPAPGTMTPTALSSAAHTTLHAPGTLEEIRTTLHRGTGGRFNLAPLSCPPPPFIR